MPQARIGTFSDVSTDPSAPEQVDDGQQDDRAQERHQQTADAEVVLVDGPAFHPEQWSDQPAGQQRADYADDHVQHDALLRISPHDFAGDPADDASHDQPDNEVHTDLES